MPTEIGIIPNRWGISLLADLSQFITSGSRGWARYYSDRGALFVRSQNVRDGQLDLKDKQFVNPPRGSEGSRTRVTFGDLLITITGNSVGNVALVEEALDEAYISQHVGLVRLSEPGNGPFICRFLSPGSPGNAQIWGSQSGQSKPGLTLRNLQEFWVALPPPLEQRAISETLSDMDSLIESLGQVVAKKRQIRDGAMRELLCPSPLDMIRPLRKVSSLKGRIGWQGLKQTEFSSNDDEPFLITGMNFKDGAIRWQEVYHISEARYQMAPEIQLRPEDVLMTKDGTIGKVLYIDSIPFPHKASLNSHLLLFRPIGGSYHPKYLYYQLSSQRFKEFVESSKSGTTFFGLSQAAVGTYPVVLPPVNEQTRIAAILSDMDSDIVATEAKLATTRQIKQGMMQELLTGRIRLV